MIVFTIPYFSTSLMVVCLLLLLSLLPAAHSTILVTSPLVTPLPNNSIPYFYSNYGTIHYQKVQNYQLLLLNSSLCNLRTNLTVQTPTLVVVPQDFSVNCTSVQQAIIAEHLGFQGIIVSSEYTKYTTGQIVMADDGNGRRVHIVCLFISSETEALLKQIKGPIQISSKFPLPKQEKAAVTFFLSASQRSSYLFLKQLKADYSRLQAQVDIQPVYFTFQSSWISPENCFGEVFCSYDYDNYQTGAGRAIITSELMQYNVFKQHGVAAWLNYMDTFDEVCTYNWDNIDHCHILAQTKLGLSGVGVGDQPLETLKHWREQEEQFAFETFPEIAINGVIFRGNLDYSEFSSTLCESITTPPSICSGSQDQPSSSSQSKPVVVVVIFMTLVTIVFLSFIAYRRCVGQEMSSEMTGRVNELVANYANLVSLKKKEKKDREHETLNEEL